jgi:hypothetical protein
MRPGSNPTSRNTNGSTKVDTDPDAALADFKRAVDLGARMALPYIHVAHDALLHGEFQRCVELCDRILSLALNDHVRAAALQWMAIARFEMGTSTREVLRLLEAAMLLDPLNEQVQQNLGVFLHLSAAEGGAALDARWPGIRLLDPTLISPNAPGNPCVPVAT